MDSGNSAFEWKMFDVLFDSSSHCIHFTVSKSTQQLGTVSPSSLYCRRLHITFLFSFCILMVECYQLWFMVELPVSYCGKITGNSFKIMLDILFRSSSRFKQLNEKMQFVWYNAYGYGLPFSWTLGIFVIDKIESIPNHLKPGMGINGCFPMSERHWNTFHSISKQLFILWQKFIILDGLLQELVFFYLPASILLISNIVLFVLTAKRIHQVQIEANKNQDATLQENTTKVQKILNKKKDM